MKKKVKIGKYSYYVILPVVLLIIFFIGFLVGLSASNYAHAAEKDCFESTFVISHDRGEWY